ncbi:MAG: hypothetical protein GY751_13790, partial [Bacteroidetes bacterium]|nr:hypothetical protein [Bacteroidota bacterium]
WISPQVICENEVPLLLDDLLLPEATPGGFWMIEGIETDILAPEEYSSGVIEVTYTAGTPPCEELNTQYINISPSPAVAWQSPEAMCISDTAFVLNTLLLPGSTEEGSWTINGEVSTSFNPEILGTGNHIIAYAAGEAPCANEETFQATVHPVPVALFTAFPDTICLTDTLTVEFTGEDSSDVVYFWDFAEGNIISGEDVGPYTINWDTSGAHIMSLTIEQNGCLSEPFSQQVEVTEALENPVISCINTTLHSVTFGWEEVENAVGYNITTLSGQSGVQENNTFIVENLSPAEEVIIQIEALSGNTCANTFTQYNCVATDCPAVDIEINESVLLCANDGLVALSVSSINVDSLGTGVWSGQGIIDSIQGVFDPAISDSLNTIVFTWTQANCIYADTILLVVNEPPSSDFEITSPICVTESTIITYIGNASPTANYIWNFNGGVAVPDTGSGPLEVSWNSSGLKEVSLQVDENGCSSEESMNIVEVEEPLPPPVLNCNTTTQSITFTWEEVPGAVGYNFNHLSGAMGIQVGSSYEVTSLSSGDEVSIQVEAIGDGACGNSLSEILSCIALDCPNVTIFLETIPAICLNDINTPLNLTAVVNGANGEGTGTWSGNGITDPVMGTYDATIAGAGEHTITYTYHEGNCVYSQTITITVFETPTASFIADEEICETASSTMIYTGSAGNEAIYTWDFDEGTAIPGTGAGPHEVSWTNSGTYQLSLTVEENACISETETIDIIVGEVLQIPEINCQPTNTSIEFSWLEIPGAEAYEVNVLSGQNGTLNDTSYFLNDLLPLEEVSIEVIALNNGICGNSSSIASCTVSECPSLQAGMNSPDAICIGDELVLGFSINSTSNGPFDIILSDGQAEWILSGIQDGHESSFSPITSTTYTIISITDLSLPACIYNPPISQTVEVNTPSIAGTALPPIHFCVGTDTLVYLPDLLVGEDIGGQWLETSVFPSFGEGFNSNPGTFNTIGQVAGEYSFRYFIAGTAPCEDAESEVSIILDALPIADAGEDKELSCAIEMVTIGGMNTSEESFIDYYWESNNGSFIADSTSNYTEVSQAGIYTLHVQNAETACGTSDEVVVSILLDVPVAEVVVSDISCFQMNDGSIEITSVSGGIPPYLLTLNGVSYSDQNHFDYLGPDNYELKVEDSQGCQSELQIDLLEPNELKVKLTAQLEGDNIIELGDSVQLEVKLNLPLGQQIENILWSPADSVDCKGEDCLHPVVYPENLTTYKIQIVTDHNCRAEDKLTIVVEKPRPVYIPNAFSPDGDGQNDYFMIFAGQQVKKINSFLVFNRWGEPVFQYYNFQPNNPAYGWNGRYRGQIMNPAVFAYYAEIEFIDGEIRLYEGDVTLVR